MNFKKILFVLLAVTIYVPESIAYDINDAVKLALQNSEGLKAQRKKLEITMLSKPKAITGFLPSISANLSHNRYEDKADSLQKTNNYNGLVINIEQEIFAGGGSIAKIAASNASINSAYQEYLESFNDLMLKAVKSYQNVVTSRKIVNVQKENVKMSKKNVEKSRIAVKAGAERKSALLVAKAELSAAQAELQKYEIQLVNTENNYNYYIGEGAPQNIKELNFEKGDIASSQVFEKEVMAKNPSINKAKYDIKTSQHNKSMAVSKLSPVVSVAADFLRNNNKDLRKGNTYSLKVTVPIFNKGIDYIGISEETKKYKQSQNIFDDNMSIVKSKLMSIWNNHIGYKDVYYSYVDAEKNYFKTYKAMLQEFDAGARTITDVIETQRRYNHSTIKKLDEESQYKLSYYEMHNLIGDLPRLFNHQVKK